jgi:ParB family chromosome partitioning protein
MSTTTATAYEVGHLYEVDPGTLKIGANVRTDTHPDAKEFAASIKTRGVLEVISAYVDPDGALTVLRGQRRTVVAAKVGTPTGPSPCASCPPPTRSTGSSTRPARTCTARPCTPRETRDAVEQLAMLGVSAAQIAKRVALPRATVDSRPDRHPQPRHQGPDGRHRDDLEEAAIFAEFEDDPGAIDTLTQAWESPWRRRQIPHIVQRLRDERAEARRCRPRSTGCAAEGLPVLDPGDVPPTCTDTASPTCARDGQDVPEESGRPSPEPPWSSPSSGPSPRRRRRRRPEPCEPEQVYVPVWVCTDPAAATCTTPTTSAHEPPTTSARARRPRRSCARTQAEAEARREAESAERRRVIANNKAWKAAEVVRREWLAGLLTRRTVPPGPSPHRPRRDRREYSLSHALQHGHALLPALLGVKPVEDATAHLLRQPRRAPASSSRPPLPRPPSCARSPPSSRRGRAQRHPHVAQPHRLGRRRS